MAVVTEIDRVLEPLSVSISQRETEGLKLDGKSIAKLTPEGVERIIARLEERYSEDEPVFYSKDGRVFDTFGISYQSLNDILTVAQGENVIPIPKHQGQLTFYPREEIFNALRHVAEFRRQGVLIEKRARQVRQERRESKFTLAEIARIVGTFPVMLQKMIVEGEFTLGDPILDENIRRINGPSGFNKRVIDKANIEPFQRHLFKRLTRGHFEYYRYLYVTVMEVAGLAGCSIKPQRAQALAELLKTRGIQVAHLPAGTPRHFNHVFLKIDEAAAVEVIRSNL